MQIGLKIETQLKAILKDGSIYFVELSITMPTTMAGERASEGVEEIDFPSIIGNVFLDSQTGGDNNVPRLVVHNSFRNLLPHSVPAEFDIN